MMSASSVAARLMSRLSSLFGGGPGPITHEALNRSNYKAIWNSVSGTEDNAKMAVSGSADEESYRISGGFTKALLERCVGVNPDDVILEIGAGVGRVGTFLAPICKEWIGTDVAENMLIHARRRLAQFSNVRTVPISGFDLSPIASESVDLVYCTVVFMHLDEWERYSYVKEGFRVLRPGGRMLVDNVNLASDEGWEFFLRACESPPANRPAQISKTSTPQEIETYFKRAGFEDIRQEAESLWTITFGKKPQIA